MPGLKHTGKWGSDRSLLNCSPSHLGRQRPLIWGTWGQKGTANELHAARCPPPAPARPFPLGFQKLGLEASQGSFINLNPKGAFANLCLSRDGISVGLRFDSNGNRTKASPTELPSGLGTVSSASYSPLPSAFARLQCRSPPVYRQRNCSTERLSSLPKVTQLLSGTAKLRSQAVCLQI